MYAEEQKYNKEVNIATRQDFSRVINSWKWKRVLKIRAKAAVGACATCVNFENEAVALDPRINRVEMARLRKRREVHYNQWTYARSLYHRRKRVGQELNEWLSIVMDAAENGNTTFPKESTATKGGGGPEYDVRVKLQGRVVC